MNKMVNGVVTDIKHLWVEHHLWGIHTLRN